jgi:hypothetical protein
LNTKKSKIKHLEVQSIVGISWYNIFMKRHKVTLKRGRCKPQDINRYNWCMVENFASMYKGVYTGMVNAGIAVELENEIMYGKFGEIKTDEKEM